MKSNIERNLIYVLLAVLIFSFSAFSTYLIKVQKSNTTDVNPPTYEPLPKIRGDATSSANPKWRKH